MNRLLYEFLVICLYGLLLIFLPIFISLLIMIYYSTAFLISNGILYVIMISLLVLSGLSTTIFFSLFANIRYIKNTTSDYNIKNEYVGIIITTSNLKLHRYFFIYFSDIMLLIELLKRKNQSFKLLTKFDVQKFNDMVYDKKCRGLYILGHGRRHGLLISEDEILYYCEYRDAPKKDFVVQMHCNHMKGKSLADYLYAKEDFPTDKIRMVEENRTYIHEKLKNELNLDAIDIFSSFLLKSLKMIKTMLKI